MDSSVFLYFLQRDRNGKKGRLRSHARGAVQEGHRCALRTACCRSDCLCGMRESMAGCDGMVVIGTTLVV